MKKDYILVTPARNEEENIERLIKSIVAQTILPKRWLIVNDDSTDRTGEIVSWYEEQYDFIEHLQLERNSVESYYSRKTQVFLLGYEHIEPDLKYDFIASVDADISFEPNYYENILKEFDKNPKLGIASGVYAYKFGDKTEKLLLHESCVPGSLQMFRRECYEEIGGYVPLKYGGDDSLASIMARMNGWKTRSFPKYQVVQHRLVGTVGGHSILRARFRQGLTDYGIATHPLFMFAKSLRRMFLEKPYILGGGARMAGFLYGYLQNREIKIPEEAANFVRNEQIKRLWSYICGREYFEKGH